jgi:hypothetical protein
MLMKKLLTAMILVSFIIMAAGNAFAADDPMDTVKTFYDYMQKGNIQNMKELVAESIIKQIAEGTDIKTIGEHLGMYLFVTAAVKEGKGTITVSNQTFKLEEKKDDSAVISTSYDVKTTIEDKTFEEKGNDKITLIKENGKWVISKLSDLTRK